MKTRVLMFLVLAAAFMFGTPSANANCGGCGYGGGYGWGWGYDIGVLYQVLRDEVPYFSAFPPVYYSYPVPRTYGYSPFAYPPGVMTPEVVGAAEPLEIINPHVPAEPKSESAAPKKKSETTAGVKHQPQPLVVLNPYVPAESLVQAAR